MSISSSLEAMLAAWEKNPDVYGQISDCIQELCGYVIGKRGAEIARTTGIGCSDPPSWQKAAGCARCLNALALAGGLEMPYQGRLTSKESIERFCSQVFASCAAY